MTADPAETRDRYEEAVLNTVPLVSYARLHLIGPAALLAAVGCLLIGFLLPQGRQQERASELVTAPAARHVYDAGLKDYYKHRSARGRSNLWSESRAKRKMDRARRGRLVTLARSAHLAHCHWRGDFIGRSEVFCDGRRLKDQLLITSFWLLLACCAIALFGWLYVQFRDSWMLPRWNPRLWYTPIYTAVVGLICCGPFLMVAAYYARAEAAYVVPPQSWPIGQPGVLLFLLSAFQIAAIALAAVEMRPRATHFAIGSGVLVVAALVTYVLLQLFLSQSRGQQETNFNLFVAVEVLLCVAVVLASRFIRSARMVRRMAALAPALMVAWAVIAFRGVLELLGARSSTISAGGEVLCFLAIAVHLWGSQASELGLWRLGAVGSRGRSP